MYAHFSTHNFTHQIYLHPPSPHTHTHSHFNISVQSLSHPRTQRGEQTPLKIAEASPCLAPRSSRTFARGTMYPGGFNWKEPVNMVQYLYIFATVVGTSSPYSFHY